MKTIFLGIYLLGGTLFSLGQTERKVGTFSSLKVYDRIHVELIESGKDKVEILGDDDIKVEVINKNGELKIKTKTTQFLRGKEVRVKVYYDNLNELQASQGAKITSNEILQTDTLNLTSNEGSVITLKLKVNQLTAKGNSGGEINLSGTAKSQNIVINSGAIFKGYNMKGEDVSVTTNAGGTAEIYASKSVHAKARAGGNIDIYGNPKIKESSKVLGNIQFK